LSDPSVDAFEHSMPREIAQLAKQSGGALDPLRVWATFLCRAFLRGKDECFLLQVRSPPPAIFCTHFSEKASNAGNWIN
jgi:hypothetical protein